MEEKFLKEISKIKNVEFFFGLCKILSVKLVDEEENPRNFEDMLEDLIIGFGRFNRKKKKELLDILKKANKSEDNIKKEFVNNTKEENDNQSDLTLRATSSTSFIEEEGEK